eukprot:COSAG01_NODE_5762_length_4048_cov_3.069385_1_plen_487_part_00
MRIVPPSWLAALICRGRTRTLLRLLRGGLRYGRRARRCCCAARLKMGDNSGSGSAASSAFGPTHHTFSHFHLDLQEKGALWSIAIGAVVLCLLASFTAGKFWLNQGLFLATGIPMVLLLAEVTHIGGNNPLAFIGAVSTYSGLLGGGVGAILLGRLFRPRAAGGTLQSNTSVACDVYGNEVFRNGVCFFTVLPIALADIGDKYFMAFALTHAGPGLYIVIFSSLTVFTALIRYFFLKRQLLPIQWLAICVINLGLGLTSLNAEFKKFSWELAGGIAASLACAFADAIFYVLCERALTKLPQTQRPSENDICTVHGLIGAVLTAMYISIYSLAGRWGTWVEGYKNDTMTRSKGQYEGGSDSLVAILWVVIGVIYWLHYLTFYYCTGLASSVASGVNKSAQATLVFVGSHLLFCHPNDYNDHTASKTECLTYERAACCAIVISGVLLYSVGPDFFSPSWGGRKGTASLIKSKVYSNINSDVTQQLLNS